MESPVDADWRLVPAALLLLGGLLALLRGGVDMTTGFRQASRRRETPITFVSGMRVMLIGIAVALIAAAWLWQQVWLLALGLAFGAEELWETSVVLYALRRGKRLEAEAQRRKAIAP